MKKQLYLLIAAFLCCIQCSKAQPAFFNSITVTEPHNLAQTNFPVLITVNTQVLITAGQMLATGADIRFATDTSCPIAATFLDYYIESGINTATTRIWVRLPSLAAGATDVLYMFYGNPTATPVSSFTATFPNAITVTSGNNVTLTGTQNIGWLQVDAGGTLNVQAGATLTVMAERVIINGTVEGLGRGHAGAPLSGTGTGPGAGTPSSNLASGAGGGSYGGVGGTGGLDAGDFPGVGGPIYGTPSGTDIAMGSGGGGATSVGGAGGGCISFYSNDMTLTGTINMRGVTPPTNASSGGGGGAGGGVLIHARSLNGSGTVNANGGGGSDGTSSANDGGGGGGGGRIKFFVSNTPTVITNVAGGPGGIFGTQAPGQPGGAGTANTIATTFTPLVVGVQNPAFVTPTVAITANPGTNACPGGSVTFTATPTNGGTSPTYQWYKNGILQPGTGSTYTSNSFTNGNTIIAVMQTTGACTNTPTATSNTLTMTVLPTVTPDVTITANPGATICPGNSVTFTALPINAGTPTYQWFRNNVLQAATGNTFTDNTLTNGNTVKVVITPVGVCPSTPTDTSNIVTMTVNPNVTPDVTIASDLGTSICAGAAVTFTAVPTNAGTPTYQWFKNNVLQAATGNTFTDNTLANGNTIRSVITAVGVCTTTPIDSSNIITMTVTPNVTPDVTVAVAPATTICFGGTAIFTATPTNGGGTPTYQWFKNNVLQAATGTTYSDNNITNGSIIKAVLTSSEQCVTATTDTSANITMTITPSTATLAGATGTTETDNENVSGNVQVHYSDCDLIAAIAQTGVSPVSGATSVSVTIDNTVSTFNNAPYVQRHYDIVPATAPSISTGTITLYALQSEFDAYNAVNGGYPDLPTGGVDNGNVKITQYHGTGTAPGNYTGAAELIIPAVSWDATNNWWVMTFPVTGFSGFYIHTAWTNNPLAITLVSVHATNIGSTNRIDWETATEATGDAFALERSVDGRTFTSLMDIPANGTPSKYKYNDERAVAGINYYRIKLTDLSGDVRYSNVVTARVNGDNAFSVQAYPNPAKDKLTITTTGDHADNGNIIITDMIGRVMSAISFTGEHMQVDISHLGAGNYIIKYTDDVRTSTIKVTKQ